ncbi:hypothetical protein V6N11_003944 [Hibiscus sabdariffa]|uniref:Pentatricopeptide repeat-containing protein n=1 Tax=Hibiscus sabdariffa TaxID=183260 RepID=A0ABR2SES3_9ROSI
MKVMATLRANREIWKAIELIEFLERKGIPVGFESYELVVEGCLDCCEYVLAGKSYMQSWHSIVGLVLRYHLEGGSKISLVEFMSFVLTAELWTHGQNIFLGFRFKSCCLLFRPWGVLRTKLWHRDWGSSGCHHMGHQRCVKLYSSRSRSRYLTHTVWWEVSVEASGTIKQVVAVDPKPRTYWYGIGERAVSVKSENAN